MRRPADWTQGYTRTDYDAAAHVTRTIAPNGEEAQQNYSGRAMSVLGLGRNGDNNKIVKWQEVDGFGNLKTVRTWYWGWNGSSYNWIVEGQVSLTHDVTGNLTNVSHPTGHTTTMSYNLAGGKTSMNDPDLGAWSYEYDRQGKLIRQTDAKSQTICLYYDSMARLVGKHFRTNTSCPTSTSYNVSYGYDASHDINLHCRQQLTWSWIYDILLQMLFILS